MSDTITVMLQQQSSTTTEGTARQHRVLVDRPLQAEGSDRGPMGGELFLLGLGGCFLSNLLAAVRTREAPVTDIRVEVIATKESAPPRFSAIELRVSARHEDEALMRKLVTIAEKGCLVANSIRRGMSLSVSVT